MLLTLEIVFNHKKGKTWRQSNGSRIAGAGADPSVQANSPVSDVVINSITADSALCQACSHLPSHTASMPEPVILLADRCLRLLSSCAQIGVKPTTHVWQVWCRTCWYLYLYLPAIPRVPHSQGPTARAVIEGEVGGLNSPVQSLDPQKIFYNVLRGIDFNLSVVLFDIINNVSGIIRGLKSTPCNTL